MTEFHIASLDHRDPPVAMGIHSVMMEAYRAEAHLLGVSEFPPLRRTRNDIMKSDSAFIGAYVGNAITAVLEAEADQEMMLNIAALVVRPEYFRLGLATALVRRTIDMHPDERIVVSTGLRNTPAIALYTRLGFEMSDAWVADQGIEMVRLTCQR